MNIIHSHNRFLPDIIQDVLVGNISKTAAASEAGKTRRQIRHECDKALKYGLSAVGKRLAVKPNTRNKIPKELRSKVLKIYQDETPIFGPTLFRDFLEGQYGIEVSKTTLRKWLSEENLWLPRVKREGRIFQLRERIECHGEMIQVDGSHHRWLYECDDKFALLVFVDCATGNLMHLDLFESESTFSYFSSIRAYIEKHGKPAALYSDMHGVFRKNHKGASSDDHTQFGRAMHQLNIQLFCATTPQAKGLVEGRNKTLQDRLVKFLWWQKADTVEKTRKLLPTFIADFNGRFGVEPANPKNLHAELTEEDRANLNLIFTVQENRILAKDLSFNYRSLMFVVAPDEQTRKMRGREVIVHDFGDGRYVLFCCGRQIFDYSIFDKKRRLQAQIVENKDLEMVAKQACMLREKRESAASRNRKRSGSEKRKKPAINMFSRPQVKL